MEKTHRSKNRGGFHNIIVQLAVWQFLLRQRPPEGGVNGRKMNLSRLVLSKIVFDLGELNGEFL